MITFEHVSKKFADGTEALKDINLHIEQGELLTLIGPSGCGKTTTMKMINRLIEPSGGQISIDGKPISDQDPVELRRSIGYVIQQIGLLPHMTIAENIALIPKLKKWDKSKIDKRVDEMLNLVGLEPSVFRSRYPLELSGGQQQRVGVIRALAAEPPIILMDEPFSALDPISREQLQDELVKLQKEIQKTIVFVTHDMDEAMKIADRIAIMKDGEILQLDTPDRLLRHPKNEFVRNFIGDERMAKGQAPTAVDLMIQKVATVKESRGLAEAFRLMKSERVDSLVVTGPEQQYKGIVTLDQVQKHYESDTKRIADVIERIEPIQRNTLYPEIAKRFAEKQPISIPVVEGEKLTGLVTRSSMMRGLAGLEQLGYKEEEPLNE
ncbi:betaine/proline/choline family ABC transporter ATP-binding protein [Bacillus hwajinpoensis]|uniref:Quaternary amine transport ATP-binding protein n=1 Tax=Guptibacillus hwajinpoensis TaxID=208199 RepID=A0A845F4Z9_9BACL|nr:ABC transporter ATP-binding protein [Pseudalkalibacillus hwajinpoensis]MYL65756.1 betaine/proline/choline family ABC transporter ATP-binding protein [Pseudalkalibacillus hwajinpoensis]